MIGPGYYESIQAYNKAKEMIGDCPTIFFIDPNAPIIAQTDASDYGIGLYVFQVISGKERPIAISSHSLSTEQSHWSVIEKELYAIYYFLHKFDYLFKNNHFILQTDHRNLVYLNTEGSAKVRRWKMALLEFDFHAQFIMLWQIQCLGYVMYGIQSYFVLYQMFVFQRISLGLFKKSIMSNLVITVWREL